MTPVLADDGEPERVSPERRAHAIDAETRRQDFTLTPPDRDQGHQCRGAVNTLGVAVPLCTRRWYGYVLPDTRDVPAAVIETSAWPLGV